MALVCRRLGSFLTAALVRLVIIHHPFRDGFTVLVELDALGAKPPGRVGWTLLARLTVIANVILALIPGGLLG